MKEEKADYKKFLEDPNLKPNLEFKKKNVNTFFHAFTVSEWPNVEKEYHGFRIQKGLHPTLKDCCSHLGIKLGQGASEAFSDWIVKNMEDMPPDHTLNVYHIHFEKKEKDPETSQDETDLCVAKNCKAPATKKIQHRFKEEPDYLCEEHFLQCETDRKNYKKV